MRVVDETAEHLARLAVCVLERAPLVAGLAALTFGEVRDGVGRGASKLIGEMSVVLFDLLDDGTKLRDDFQCDLICDGIALSFLA